MVLIKYYVIKHLILLKVHDMMDINVDLFPWFTNFLIESMLATKYNPDVVPVNQHVAGNLQNPIDKTLKKKTKYILPLKKNDNI